MADPFVAEIRIFPFSFPPTGWAFCNGQLMPISQNTALFSLLGTVYGGDGKSNFALPDMNGNAPMHPGQGSGLSLRGLGQIGGAETVTLLESEMPFHTHNLQASGTEATTVTAAGNMPAMGIYDTGQQNGLIGSYSQAASPNTQMGFQAISVAGGSVPHNNMQPYLTLSFCIALQGVYPARP